MSSYRDLDVYNISLELFSKKIKVDPSAELIKELKLMPEIAYKIMDR